MKFFINLGVNKKLIAVFSVVCIFMISIGVEGILSSARINEGGKAIYSTNLISIKDLEEMKGNINETRANMLRIVFERDKSKLNEEIQAIDNTTDRNKKNQEEYERLPATDE